MKKSLILIAVLTGSALLLRLPHPARDISNLLPVQTLYLYMEENLIYIESDTGDRGSGSTLTAAADALKRAAPGEIFLETARFLILDRDVDVTEEFHSLLRPTCRVVYTNERPDLNWVSRYLVNHPPHLTLARIRAEQNRKEPICAQTNDPPSGSWLLSLHPSPIIPAAAGSQH